MRRLMYGACLVAGLSLSAGVFSQVTLNFSEPGLSPGFGPDPFFPGNPKGTDVEGQFASLGATFTKNAFAAAYVGNDAFVTGTLPLSWDNFLAINTIPPYGSDQGIVSIVFHDPNDVGVAGTVDGGSLSFKISDINPVPSQRVAVRTFDLGSNLVEEFFLNQFEDIFIFTTGNVHRVEFEDNGADGFVIDDFSYGAVTIVPEPATVLALAPLGLWVVARKRRA